MVFLCFLSIVVRWVRVLFMVVFCVFVDSVWVF